MSWIAQKRDRSDKIHDNSLPKETMSFLRPLIEKFCLSLAAKGQVTFRVSELISWSKLHCPGFVGHFSK